MDDLVARVAAHLRRLTERRGMKKKLADALGQTPSAITPYIDGRSDVTLRMLAALSRISGISVVELVADPGRTIRELSDDEAALIDWLRLQPRLTDAQLGALQGALAVLYQQSMPPELRARLTHRRVDPATPPARGRNQGNKTPSR